MTTNETYKLTINDLSTSGDGIAKHNGAVYFIKGATIGDVVMASVIRKNNNYYLAKIESFIKRSPWRREAPCPHFGPCGSCQIQNLNYAAQLNYKENQVKEALQRIGGFNDLPLKKIIPSEHEFFYRNKAQLPLGYHKKIELGYYRLDSHEIIDLQKCHLHHEDTISTALALKDFFKQHKISIYNEKKQTGLLRHLIIRESHYKKELLVGLVVTDKDFPHLQELFKTVDLLNTSLKEYQVSTLVLNINNEKTNRITGKKNIVLKGSGFLEEKIGDHLFNVYLDTFLQINHAQAEKAYRQIASYIRPDSKLTADIYCGIGTISFYAAQKSAAVIGIENNPASIEAANENCKKNNITNCRFICTPAEKIETALLKEASVFIVDPPRKGLDEKVIELILTHLPQQLIYLSCNPATLARDLKIICDSSPYQIKEVTPFDFFPQTTHVETLVYLEKTS